MGGQGLRALKLPLWIILKESALFLCKRMWLGSSHGGGEQYPPRSPHLRVLLRMSTPREFYPVHCYTPQPRTAPGRWGCSKNASQWMSE